MPVFVNLLDLDEGPMELEGEVSAGELAAGIEDELIHLNQPLSYALTVRKQPESLMIQGHYSILLDCECSRCLAPFEFRLENKRWTAQVELSGEDKVAVRNDCVDLTPEIREDMVLAFPRHPLCKTDCPGLKSPSTDASGKSGSEGETDHSPTPWSELDKLNL